MARGQGSLLTGSIKIQLIILALLLLNTAMIVFGYYFVVERYLGEEAMFHYKQELARDLADYNHRMAAELGVYDLATVREALAAYNYAVDIAVTSEELIRVVLNQGRQAQDVIFAAADARLKEKILIAINNDARVKQTYGKMRIYIRVANGEISITPEQFLETQTIHRIQGIYLPARNYSSQTVEIEIDDGVAELVGSPDYEEQLRNLSDDLNTMRMRLHEIRVQSGMAEMVGPGITLSVYDGEEHRGSESLVHDADIRDLVNELFSAGARGISVGGQRLATTSAIRCSGPLIMVNYRQIATNPVIIQAVGNPDLLISGLNIIIYEMETRHGLTFEIDDSGFIKLPAYMGIN